MNHPLPTYSLRSIEIENFKGIKHTKIEDLPKEAKWIFLTGKNGYGKSCVLQAIAIPLLKHYYALKVLERIYLETINIQDDYLIKISCIANSSGEEISFDASPNRRFKDLSITVANELLAPPVPTVAYGSSRLNIQAVQSANEEKAKSTPYYSLFNPDAILLNIEPELINWYYRSQLKESQLEQRDIKYFEERYENAKNTLLKVMPNISEITIDAKENKVVYSEKDEENEILTINLVFDQLASGNRNIIAMIGDMIIRLFQTQSTITNPADLEGIVIIDELDLHLHPSWQKALPGLLSEIFPKIQFIASTHSPIPFLGAPEGSVFLKVNRTEEEGITLERLDIDISNLTPNLILSSPIFGFTDIFPITHDEDERIRTEDTMQEAAMNDYVQEQLIKSFSKEKQEELKKLFKRNS